VLGVEILGLGDVAGERHEMDAVRRRKFGEPLHRQVGLEHVRAVYARPKTSPAI
jgi:hypothetical protein